MILILGSLTACQTSSKKIEKKQKLQPWQVSRLWTRNTVGEEYKGPRLLNRMTPVVTGSLVIQGNGVNGIAAYDRKTGSQVWKLDVQNGVEGGAQATGGRLFFGGGAGQFYSVDVETGDVIWTFPVRAQTLAEPYVRKGVVYFLSGNNIVYALDALSGKQKWLYKRLNSSALSIRGGSRPAIYKSRLYIGTSDGFLVALNVADGSLAWERRLSTNARFTDIDTTPFLHKGKVYVSSYDGELFCLERENGQILWRVPHGGYTGLTIVKDTIFYAGSEGQIFAIDKDTGRVLWRRTVAEGIATQVRYYKGLLIFGESSGALKIYRAKSGRPLTEFQTGRGISATPSVSKKGDVYVVSNQGYLYALALKRKTVSGWPWEVEK